MDLDLVEIIPSSSISNIDVEVNNILLRVIMRVQARGDERKAKKEALGRKLQVKIKNRNKNNADLRLREKKVRSI